MQPQDNQSEESDADRSSRKNSLPGDLTKSPLGILILIVVFALGVWFSRNILVDEPTRVERALDPFGTDR